MKNLLKILGTVGMSTTIVASSISVISCGAVVKELINDVLGVFGFSLDQVFSGIRLIEEPLEFVHKLHEFREAFTTRDGLKNLFSHLLQSIGSKFDFTQVTYKPIVDVDWPSISHIHTWPSLEDLEHPIKWIESKVHRLGLEITVKPDSTRYRPGTTFYGFDNTKNKTFGESEFLVSIRL